jgi:hypothetical protein
LQVKSAVDMISPPPSLTVTTYSNGVERKKSKWRYWLWMLPLFLWAAFLGSTGLDNDPLSDDESKTVYDIGAITYGPLTPVDVWNRVGTRNPWHAPGYFILTNQWMTLVGWEPLPLRFFSLLFGMLTVAWTYRLGKDFISQEVGLYGAAVIGTSTLFVDYLFRMRMYTMITVETAFTVWIYLHIINSRGTPKRWLWLGLFVGVVSLLYTHYLTIMILIGIGLYHLFFVKKDRTWWTVVGVMGLAGALFVPWVTVALEGLSRATEAELVHQKSMTPLQTAVNLLFWFSNGSWILLIGLSICGLLVKSKAVRQMFFFSAVIVLLGVLLTLALRIIPENRLRYMMTMWPVLSLGVGAGMYYLRRWHPRLPIIALLIWMGVAFWNSANARAFYSGNLYPYHLIARELAGKTQPGDVLTIHYEPNMIAAGIWITGYHLRDYHLNGVNYAIIGSDIPYAQAKDYLGRSLDFQTARPLRVWAIYRDELLYREDFEASLPDEYERYDLGVKARDMHYEIYTRSPVCVPQADDAPVMARFGEGVSLTALDEFPDTVGDTLPVIIGWQVGADVPPNKYSVALHVTDQTGELVAQADYGLPGLAFSCIESNIALDDLPAGEYTLNAVVYAWESGERLPGVVTSTGAQGDRLPLATFEVNPA